MRRLLAVVLLALSAARAWAGGGPAETVVLVNADSPESQRVAKAYVAARKIPPWQVCEVRCTKSLETPMTDFVRDVADPLRDFLRRGEMEDRVRFVVLTQDMPIRARTPGGDVSTAAALSLLHTPLCGADQERTPRFRNPYTEGPACRAATSDGSRFLLVTALLSTTADEAIALIDRSVRSDEIMPTHPTVLFQDAKGAANVRNAAYDAARAKLEALGARTEHLKAGPKEAVNRQSVMGYMAGGVYSDLTAEGVATNEYLPGAISDHLQSFGAVPQNFAADPKSHTQFPITHMVRAGITGVHGAVQEPYNIAFPDADLFLPYFQGYTLAETFHQRSPLVYWMDLTLGDPLCAPYAARPRIDAKAAVKDGKLQVVAHAPGAVRIDVYAGGRRVASTDGQHVTADVAPESLLAAAGDGVLVEATGPGAHEPRGWTWLADARTSAIARGVVNSEPAPVSSGALILDAPLQLVAGAAGTMRVKLLGPDGKAQTGWRGLLELRTANPPVRVFARDVVADKDGGVDVPVRWTRAGSVELQVRLAAARASQTVQVVAAAPHHATTPLDQLPVLQPVDVPVVVEDEFGNVAAYDGELTMTLAGDARPALPSARAAGGWAVFRDVVFERQGRQLLVIAGAGGKVLSQAGEGVTPVPSALRAWIVSCVARGDAGTKLFNADLRAADRDGAVDAGLLFRRRREKDDVIDVPSDTTGDAVAAVTFLEATAPAKVRVLGAAAGRMKVSLDGKTLYDGFPKQIDPGGAREQIAALEISEGPHRLEVVADRKDRLAFALEIAPEAGKPGAPPIRVLPAATPKPPRTFVVSGRVVRGKEPAAGVKVVVKGADNRERTATTAPDGTWFTEGLPPGAATARVRGEHSPPGVALQLADAHATDVDFALRE